MEHPVHDCIIKKIVILSSYMDDKDFYACTICGKQYELKESKEKGFEPYQIKTGEQLIADIKSFTKTMAEESRKVMASVDSDLISYALRPETHLRKHVPIIFPRSTSVPTIKEFVVTNRHFNKNEDRFENTEGGIWRHLFPISPYGIDRTEVNKFVQELLDESTSKDKKVANKAKLKKIMNLTGRGRKQSRWC